jgi:phosphoribosyl 1,2-cyclic phosphate phosphodiesterase
MEPLTEQVTGLQLLFLGTGTSAGVPMIGCHCPVCSSDDPHNHRSRASAIVRYPDAAGKNTIDPFRQYLIDTTPELRLEMIRHKIDRLNGVFYTHNHADHVFGIDDLRRFNAVMDAPLDIYAEQRVIEWLRHTFGYIFESHKNINQSFIPELILQTIEPQAPVPYGDATWTPIRLLHGRLPILGFRIDYQDQSLAYCTDVSGVPPEAWPLLENLDVLVLDALRFRHHPTHMTIDRALEVANQVQPQQTYFTHMSHEIDHAKVDAELPDGVNLAYDGLLVDVARQDS